MKPFRLKKAISYLSRQPKLSALAPLALALADKKIDQKPLHKALLSEGRSLSRWLKGARPRDIFHYCHLVDHYFFSKPSCLRVAIAAYSLCESDVSLKIGVKKSGEFEAHAWLEHNSEVLSAIPLESYEEIYTHER